MTRANDDLPAALRAWLRGVAARGTNATYQEAAQALGLTPPNTIHRVATALETTMVEDVRAGRPIIASLVVSRVRGCPAPGFFELARDLGRYDGGDPDAFAAAEAKRARAYLNDT